MIRLDKQEAANPPRFHAVSTALVGQYPDKYCRTLEEAEQWINELWASYLEGRFLANWPGYVIERIEDVTYYMEVR